MSTISTQDPEGAATSPAPARLRGMASDPRNVLDMGILVEAAQAVEDRAEMLVLLRRLEWKGEDGVPVCPDCGEMSKHGEDCELAGLLARLGTGGA